MLRWLTHTVWSLTFRTASYIFIYLFIFPLGHFIHNHQIIPHPSIYSTILLLLSLWSYLQLLYVFRTWMALFLSCRSRKWLLLALFSLVTILRSNNENTFCSWWEMIFSVMLTELSNWLIIKLPPTEAAYNCFNVLVSKRYPLAQPG